MGDPTTTDFQKAVIDTAAQKLGRILTEQEKRFITSRGGYIALEIILDTVQAKFRDDVERYLNSES